MVNWPTILIIDVMDIFIDLTADIPTPSRLWFGPKLVIIIGKAEDMQKVLNSPNCLEKTYVYKFLEKNVGLFSAPGLSDIKFRKSFQWKE